MRGNFVVCGNEVFVEGFSVGCFSSMDVTAARDSIACTATVELPLYSVAAYRDGTRPGDDVALTRRSRVGVDMDLLRVGARVDVWCWYSCEELDVRFERVLVFRGYIRQVVGGFPSVLRCEDLSFALRFGSVERVWKSDSTLLDIINAVLPVSEGAFSEFRNRQGFSADGWQRISVVESDVVGGSYDMEVWKDISPYDALQKLVNLFSVYGSVDDEGRLYVGLGESAPERGTVMLSTRLNVVGCDITTKDSLFENYRVRLTCRTAEGKVIESVYGDEDGEQVPVRMMPMNTQEGLDGLARNIYNRLVGGINEGSITTLLYPRVRMFDFIGFEHTLFGELSGDYVCTGLQCSYGKGGYRQVISVTDRRFTV